MNGDKLFTLAGTIVVLATITVLVTNGANTAKVLGGFGGAFSGAIKTAMGR